MAKGAKKESCDTLVYCSALNCVNNKQEFCDSKVIHLQGCSPDADNVFGCSEFVEQAPKEQNG